MNDWGLDEGLLHCCRGVRLSALSADIGQTKSSKGLGCFPACFLHFSFLALVCRSGPPPKSLAISKQPSSISRTSASGLGKMEKDVDKIKKELADDTRDVADLWNEALRRYQGIVGVGLKPQPESSSVTAMVEYGTVQMNNFHRFRHDQKKVDKLRSLLKQNLGYIEAGAKQLVTAATPAFPPAAAIGTAFNYLLKVRFHNSPPPI